MVVRDQSQARVANEAWNSPSRSISPMAHYQGTPAGTQLSGSNAYVYPSPDRHFWRSPTPEQANFSRRPGYVRLLEHVIQMSTQLAFPHHDSVPQVGNGVIYQGFNHEDAFGVRSLGQVSHDIKIGAAGELLVFEILSSLLSNREDNFGRENWKSRIRHEVTVHPAYSDMPPWRGTETADIVFSDFQSTLTGILVQHGYLDETWVGACPRYFIEVKTTTGECDDRFFMSNGQFLRMQSLALTEGRVTADVYVIFRVYHLTRDSIDVKIYVDPEAHRRNNNLVFDAQSWSVKRRA
ncbi:hypothetical protein ONS95_005692 [Cadophora gregata]|uniref:uncharacterized protein n=1 Tax=Cadophora gregata TaxID=51156 RepID=UPI0026DC9EF1|nr:uncharacterized protein ONS95_005692 [Cadophora gregata]KAK0103682.1 hypothetical protein ONS95_005692 [Cadophora gregata]KAK0107872.1 hypothetical protein ONS96_003661 [Cadophora gregata f. sp. sojae]